MIDDPGQTFTVAVQVVTAGGFAAFAWYLITKHIPKVHADCREDARLQHASFSSDLEKQRTAFTDALRGIESSHHDEIEETRAFSREMLGLLRKV